MRFALRSVSWAVVAGGYPSVRGAFASCEIQKPHFCTVEIFKAFVQIRHAKVNVLMQHSLRTLLPFPSNEEFSCAYVSLYEAEEIKDLPLPPSLRLPKSSKCEYDELTGRAPSGSKLSDMLLHLSGGAARGAARGAAGRVPAFGSESPRRQCVEQRLEGFRQLRIPPNSSDLRKKAQLRAAASPSPNLLSGTASGCTALSGNLPRTSWEALSAGARLLKSLTLSEPRCVGRSPTCL